MNEIVANLGVREDSEATNRQVGVTRDPAGIFFAQFNGKLRDFLSIQRSTASVRAVIQTKFELFQQAVIEGNRKIYHRGSECAAIHSIALIKITNSDKH